VRKLARQGLFEGVRKVDRRFTDTPIWGVRWREIALAATISIASARSHSAIAERSVSAPVTEKEILLQRP